MARLNEPPALTDAAEILRRKYSRQNKEIARINSTQCIRIRNLENEVSRLLADNLELREQIIRQQAEADSSNARQVIDHFCKIKVSLEAKVAELGSLISTLGDEPAPCRKRSLMERSSSSITARSPDQRNWKSLYTLSEAVGGQDGRLPPIMEDKPYPRRTLNSNEIETLISEPTTDTTDSPDIGPPPTSHFVNENPVKIDLLSKPVDVEETPSIDAASSINLEQRRKRKDSTGSLDHKRPSRFEPRPSTNIAEMAQSLKSGAKRKMSARDDEEVPSNGNVTELSPDDFKFTRRTVENKSSNKNLQVAAIPTKKVEREFAVARSAISDKSGAASATVGRKALGPKSSNTDIANSPKKNTKVGLLRETTTARNDTLRKQISKVHQGEKQLLPELVHPEPTAVLAFVDVQPEPETPAAADMFSPLSSGSSAARIESRDTPPPPDLGPGTEGQRPSRRARGAVSYAEPNLRDKMRRPTKELVDAVTGEGKAQRTSFVKLESEVSSTSAKIKQEPEEDDAWKSKLASPPSDIYCNSPLADRLNSRDAAQEMQRRSQSSVTSHGSDVELPRSNSKSTISALLAERRKIKQQSKENAEQTSQPLAEAMAKLDIYEFSGSSPTNGNEKAATSEDENYISRVSRRSSSVMPSPNPANSGGVSEADAAQKSSSWISSRRRHSSLAGEISEPEQMQHSKSLTTSCRRQSTLGLEQAISHTDLGRQKLARTASNGSNNSSGPSDPTDRVSARRRSMML